MYVCAHMRVCDMPTNPPSPRTRTAMSRSCSQVLLTDGWQCQARSLPPCTNGVDVIHSEIRGSNLPWLCHNVVLPTASRTSTWGAGAGDHEHDYSPGERTELTLSTGRAEEGPTVVITGTAEDARRCRPPNLSSMHPLTSPSQCKSHLRQAD